MKLSLAWLNMDYSKIRVPEVLAPAGGKAQFFAALNAGADAVYLGLKDFNARSRAENFTISDLSELVPLAREYGMKVLVTLNILIKQHELSSIIDLLSKLQFLGVDAVIVQDLGLARIIRLYFPGIPMHASTQMAIHNWAGVAQAMSMGFKRVVLARELTAIELKQISTKMSTLDPENRTQLEAFCHGSLCYSYSGLCFFSGAEDARSGNRGECAYTCRKPYKILNEPGHGFLFSMKDLNTQNDLDKLVRSGINTLKIEGRKKDAQYVATSVGIYRQKLNELFGFDTSPKRPQISKDYDWQKAMDFSFHRETTSLFLKGRYAENVIDLSNPTHKGKLIGTVLALSGNKISFQTLDHLERFDGIRIDKKDEHFHAAPQHGDLTQNSYDLSKERFKNQNCQFSLREFSAWGKKAYTANAGDKITLDLPLQQGQAQPAVGDLVYKIRSNELKRLTESLSEAPPDFKMRPFMPVALSFTCSQSLSEIKLKVEVRLNGQKTDLLSLSASFAGTKAALASTFKDDLKDLFSVFGEAQIKTTSMEFHGDFEFFVPRSQIKIFKKAVGIEISDEMPKLIELAKNTALEGIQLACFNLKAAVSRSAKFAIKFDRMDYLAPILKFHHSFPECSIDELIFEPKRSLLGGLKPEEVMAQLMEAAFVLGCQIRLALPTVIRAFDEPLLKPWFKIFKTRNHSNFELGNLGALKLLQEADCLLETSQLSSDFTLFTLNHAAVLELKSLGLTEVCLSVEDDLANLADKFASWPMGIDPRVILYKDTPLFIAEACSLTALHNGCPTAAVCGYRTLEIENDEGEKFFVAHESCKSIVYGHEPYCISHMYDGLQKLGVAKFRVDFLTRHYEPAKIESIMASVFKGQKIQSTHSANFSKTLL